jgi:DNA-binding response OmpR family regulator
VLLIEPDEQLVRLVAWILRDAGYDVSTVYRLEEALALPAHEPPKVILYDGTPPHVKAEGVAALRRCFEGVRVIDMHEHEGGRHAHHGEADAHLHKPFHADDLLQVIEQV